MPTWLTALLIGGAIGLIGGYYIARKSAATKPITGGSIAYICNYIASVAISAVAPTLLIGSLFLHIKIGGEFLLAVGLTLLSVVALIIFGYLETQPTKP